MTAPDTHHLIELECDVLGALLNRGDHGQALLDLQDAYFQEPINREILATIRLAGERYGTSAMPTVAKLIPQPMHDRFKTENGSTLNAYLAGLVSNTSLDAANLPRGVKALAKQWARIEIGRETSAAAEAAKDPLADPAHLMRTLMDAVDEISVPLRQGGRVKSRMAVSEAVDVALSNAREARTRGGLVGITTGLADLDRATGGFHRRDLNIIAARPAMGKTTLGVKLARAAAEAGHGVGFFSLEMDNAKIGARFASDIAHEAGIRIPYQAIIKGDIGPDQETQIADAMAALGTLGLALEDASGLTMSGIRTKTESMLEAAQRAGRPLSLLIIDHLGKVRPSQRYAGNRNNEIGEITNGLKELAREYDLAVVLLSQLSRGVEGRDDKRPGLMDLRDSGNIEQDADAVFFLYREAYYLERQRPDDPLKRLEWEADMSAVRHKGEMIIGKQRNGPTYTIDLWVDVACSAVRNAAYPQHGA